jgi:hypothetical protein
MIGFDGDYRSNRSADAFEIVEGPTVDFDDPTGVAQSGMPSRTILGDIDKR